MKFIKSNILEIRNYVIMYIVFAIGGVNLFTHTKSFKVFIVIVFGIIFFKLGKQIDLKFTFTMILIITITTIQILDFHAGSIINIGYLMILLLIPYLAVKIIGYDYINYYINITYFFCIISLIFYTFQSLSSSFYQFTSTIAPTLGTDPNPLVQENFIIYTFEHHRALNGLVLRNPGPFWEPSAMGAFTFLALLLNTLLINKLKNKKNIVFIIVLITTFSTAAYVSLMMFLLFHYFRDLKNLLLLPILLIPMLYMFTQFDFLGDKLIYQFNEQSDIGDLSETDGRFSGALKSLVAFSRRPLFGRGIILPTAAKQDSSEGGGYGFFALAMRLGVFGATFYFYNFFAFWRKLAVISGNPIRYGTFYGLSLFGVMFGISVYDTPIYLMLILTPIALTEFSQTAKT
jgi:hypothetical protein